MHQEMTCLSARGWSWALPHYLPFCLTPEAEYNRMETEFLISVVDRFSREWCRPAP
jgi:hypothetical protein